MPTTAIETCELTRRFGTQLAVNRLNLVAPEAGVYGFLGPNGAGKPRPAECCWGSFVPTRAKCVCSASRLPETISP